MKSDYIPVYFGIGGTTAAGWILMLGLAGTPWVVASVSGLVACASSIPFFYWLAQRSEKAEKP